MPSYHRSIRLTAVLGLWIAAACLQVAAGSAFIPERLSALDRAVEQAVGDRNCPGGVLWLERGEDRHVQAYGNRMIEPAAERMTLDTIFDAASLTKVIATTPAVARLLENGRLELDAPVSRYLKNFNSHGKDSITIRHLLTHTSGLRSGLGPRGEWEGASRALAFACDETPLNPPGTAFRYSDINFILLGEIVREVTGLRVDAFCAREVFGPLGMKDTGFQPKPAQRSRVAPTERQPDGSILRGVVHDPTARRMGGVAGHAGLFTTAGDLARFARMMLGEGRLEGRRIFRPETVRLMTSVQTPPTVAARRGLGWDIDSPYAGPRGAHFPIGSYGHTGWTGTSLWIDPFSKTFLIFLSNRNHPTEEGNVLALRRTLGTLAAEAVRDFDWQHVPGALPEARGSTTNAIPGTSAAGGQVLNGIDVLARGGFQPLRGRKVGLITNHTGIDRERHPTIDLLYGAPGVTLVALFSPEHGIRGVLDEKVPDGKDEKTGVPIYSLYGEHRTPRPEQLANLDVLVFDLQDIGCRFYTYISTLGESLGAAAVAKIPFVVLDRVNPIGGTIAEGPVLEGERSFVAWHDLPIRHGMTAGELARMFNEERRLGAQLTVIPCEGWSRSQWFDATALPWINTSPNMRSLTQATLYPGVGVIEMCQISVGRGTDAPFERIGAPYINDLRLAAELNAAHLAGIRFVPIRFTPTASKFKGENCGGVELLVTDRDALRTSDLGVVLASTLHRLYPSEFGVDRMAKLLVHPPTLEAIRAGRPLDETRALWSSGSKSFQSRRDKYLLYH